MFNVVQSSSGYYEVICNGLTMSKTKNSCDAYQMSYIHNLLYCTINNNDFEYYDVDSI